MQLPEGWPTEEMIQVVQDYVGTKNRLLAKTICEKVLAAAPTPPAQEDEPSELRAVVAIRNIKAMVCGELRPNWADAEATYHTRGRIADICDVVLRTDLFPPQS